MLFRKKVILWGLEGTYAVDPVLTGGANAILTKNLSIKTFEGNKVSLDYDRPYLSADKSLHTGPHSSCTFDVDLQGSGTAGVVPPMGKLLRSCGMAEYILATAQTGTAPAGSASTITLAAGASAVNNTYNWLLIKITAGTGNGQVRRIKSYVGATKIATVMKNWTTPPDATSVYSIDAQVVYAPVSAGFESGYGYYYLDGELHKMAGARGTPTFKLEKESLPMVSLSFTSLRVAAVTGANPVADFTAWKEPLPVNDANTPDLFVHGYQPKGESISVDLANTVTYRNVINGENVSITDRDPKMSITVEKPDTATINFDAIIAAHTADEIYVIHGTVVGKIIRIDMPQVQLIEPDFSDSDGVAIQSMNGKVLPTNGDDELFITFL